MSKNTFIPTTKGLVSAHKSQDFTSDQKTQARTNIAAAASTHTHSADDIVSGALAKARQHAQTAYKDEANTWAQAQTFSSTIEVNGSGISTRYGVQISELSDGTPQWLLYKNNGSGQALLLRDLVNSRTHASFTPGTTAALARLDLLCNLYGAENLHAEKGLSATINNSWLGFSDGNNYIGGVSNFRPAVGGSATAIINGETGAATFNGTVSATEFRPTVGSSDWSAASFSLSSNSLFVNSKSGYPGYLSHNATGILRWESDRVEIFPTAASTGVGTGALQVAGGIYAGAASVFQAATFNGTVSSSTEYRLGGFSYSRVAQITSGGSWGGGYNFNLNSDTAQRDSTGAVSAVLFNGSTVLLFAESSGSPGAITPRYSFGPTQVDIVGDIKITNGSLHAGHGTTYPASANATYGTSIGYDANLEHGWIQAVRFNVGEIRALELQPLGGNVMIGTTANQSTKFHVEGTSSFSGDASFNGGVQLDNATPTQTWQVSSGSSAPTYTEAARQFQIRTWQDNTTPFGTYTDLVANSSQYNNHAVRVWVHTHGTANPVLSTTFNADGTTTFNRGLTLGADAAGAERITFQGVTSNYRTIIENNYDSNRAFAITSGGYDVIKCTVEAYNSVTLAGTGTQTTVINGGIVQVNGSTKLGIKTLATLPSAASSSGERYQVSDSATIANRIVFSNGSAWYYEGTAVAV